MHTINTKIYIILAAVLLIIVILVIALSSRKTGTSYTTTPKLPSPTPVNLIPSGPKMPATIAPTFTGANEEVPEPILNLAKQKQALRKLSPLNQNGFTVSYDFSTDEFTVTLSDPKDRNKTAFQTWLKQNYPAISSGEFIIR